MGLEHPGEGDACPLGVPVLNVMSSLAPAGRHAGGLEGRKAALGSPRCSLPLYNGKVFLAPVRTVFKDLLPPLPNAYVKKLVFPRSLVPPQLGLVLPNVWGLV